MICQHFIHQFAVVSALGTNIDVDLVIIRVVFDPYDLDEDVTPSTIRSVLQSKDYPKALTMSFRLVDVLIIIIIYILLLLFIGVFICRGIYLSKLTQVFKLDVYLTTRTKSTLFNCFHLFDDSLNEVTVIQEVLECIPPDAIKVVIELFPVAYIEDLLKFLASILGKTRHIGQFECNFHVGNK